VLERCDEHRPCWRTKSSEHDWVWTADSEVCKNCGAVRKE
jgi:hypothetical protein